MSGARTPRERAARLLRWYPRAWRERYGEEFAELLIAEMKERPRSAGRTLDVARAGLAARFATAGLAGSPLLGTYLADPVGASLGAAWTATIGIGATSDWGGLDRFVGRGDLIRPNSEHASLYRDGYGAFRETYRRLNEVDRLGAAR